MSDHSQFRSKGPELLVELAQHTATTVREIIEIDIAVADQIGEIPAEGCRIAGDIHQFIAANTCQVSAQFGSTLARWIDDDAVETGAACRQFPATVMDGASAKTSRATTRPCRIIFGTADGRTLAFHSHDKSALERQRDGEIAHTAVKIENRLSGYQVAKL